MRYTKKRCDNRRRQKARAVLTEFRPKICEKNSHENAEKKGQEEAKTSQVQMISLLEIIMYSILGLESKKGAQTQ